MYGMRNQTENSDQLGKEIFIANFEIDRQKLQKKQISSFTKNVMTLSFLK
jgi:hypothetical protein